MVYFTQGKTTPIEFFLGPYESPPEGLGTWQLASVADQELVREERYLLPDSAAGYLIHQVRFRDATTRAIVRVEPERRVRRRRAGRGRR